MIKSNVTFSNSAHKQMEHLADKVRLVMQTLFVDLRNKGPAPGEAWSNYGKLHCRKQEDRRHCHLIKGKPTYVCCWNVYKSERTIEVYYVGTHEKAPY